MLWSRGVPQEEGRESLERKPAVHDERAVRGRQSCHPTGRTVSSLGVWGGSASPEECRALPGRNLTLMHRVQAGQSGDNSLYRPAETPCKTVKFLPCSDLEEFPCAQAKQL